MKLIIYIVLALNILAFNCSAEYKPNIYIENIEKRELLISILKERNIPYQIDYLDNEKNEFVIWEKEDNEVVRKIVREVTKSECNETGKESITLINDEQTEYLSKLLNENGIEHSLIKNPSGEHPKHAIEFNLDDHGKIRPLMIRTIKEKHALE